MLTQDITLSVGAVVIGRNEGDRLIHCLKSLRTVTKNIVYVDSGSTDQSVSASEELAVTVVQLDMSEPFTAARARNAGLASLLKQNPEIAFVQFVDGDCEVAQDWVEKAVYFLMKNDDFAVVCGRRRERYPKASIYNQLCDIEWDTPVGEVHACGGDTLIRVSAFIAVDGYRASMIAGEEPELCFRLRQLDWRIMRLETEMTLHDAAMTSFRQWWKRNQRAGHAYAESYTLHGNTKEGFGKRETYSIFLWAALMPVGILVLSLIKHIFLIFWLIYPLQVLRLTFHHRRRLGSFYLGFIYAISNLLSKWPQFIGLAIYYKNYIHGKQSGLIEYK